MLDQGAIDWDDFRFVLAIVRGGSVSAAANPIFPMIVSGFGTTTNIFKNKICNVSSDGNALAGSVVFGILAQTAGTTYNITNNYVGDLRMPSASGATQLQGVSVGVLTAATTVTMRRPASLADVAPAAGG